MFNLPNLLTALNLMSGSLAIILALGGRLDLAPFFIFAAMIFDFFDGFAARKLGISGELGKQLDSLADMVSFGLAPGVIMFAMLIEIFNLQISMAYFQTEIIHLNPAGGPDISSFLLALKNGSIILFLPFISLVIPFCSLFRLAKFNLDTRQSESFIGLPTPANTLFFMSFPLAFYWTDKLIFADSWQMFLFNPWLISGLIIIMSIMLVSELPLFSLKFKTFGWNGNQIRYIFLLISLLFIILFWAWAFALIVFLYLILSITENIFLKTKRNEI